MIDEAALRDVLDRAWRPLLTATFEPTERELALHEAAHAVVAHHVGGRVIAATIERAAGSLGHVRWRHQEGTTLAARALTALAGVLAAARGGGGDESTAHELAREQVEAWRHEAAALVARLRPEIERLARALLERRTLDENELAAVLGGPETEDVEMTTTTESRTAPTQRERQALARTLVDELHSNGVVPHVLGGFVYLGMNADSRLRPSQIELARRLASDLIGMLPTQPARPITSALRC